jgi:predicted glycosyltransferase
MRILFDITHPAQAHFFKNVVRMLREAGDDVLVTARDKDVTVALLEALGIEHICISRMGRGLLGKARELVRRDLALLKIARRFRPDVMVGRTGISLARVGALLRIPRIVFQDTEHSRLERALTTPFASYICTGAGYLADHGRRQIRFRGPPVLAYMAPKYFQPDGDALRRAGVDPDAPYVVLRHIAWSAVHDRGLPRSDEADVAAAAERLSRFGRVFVSSETPLSGALQALRNPVPLIHMHDLLAFARLYIGESGTMAAEAAALGTPAVYCNPLPLGFLLEMQNRYGLVRSTASLAEGVPVAEELLGRDNTRRVWQQRRQKLLDDSTDVAAFMYRLIRRVGAGSFKRRRQAAR